MGNQEHINPTVLRNIRDDCIEKALRLDSVKADDVIEAASKFEKYILEGTTSG